MPKSITPVNVTPTLTGWQDVDITAHVGVDSGNVRGAILHIANQTGATRAFGVRPKGATTARTRDMANGWQAYQVVLVDEDGVFQVNCGSTSLEVCLIGYLLVDEYNGLVDEVEITPTEDGTYRTVDISAHVGSDTPIGAILALDNGCGSTHPAAYVRAVGSSDDYYWRCGAQTNTLAIVKLDANKRFEARVEGSCVNIFLLGWITANANFVTDLTLHGVSAAGQYETIDLSAEVDADAVGVWWFRDPGDSFPQDAETVKEASSVYGDEWFLGINAPAWGFTKLSALKAIEYRTADTDLTARIAVVADAFEGAGSGGVAAPSGASGVGAVGAVQVNLDATVSVTGASGAGHLGLVTTGVPVTVTAMPIGNGGAGAVGRVQVNLDAAVALVGNPTMAATGRAAIFQWTEAPEVLGLWADPGPVSDPWTVVPAALGNWT